MNRRAFFGAAAIAAAGVPAGSADDQRTRSKREEELCSEVWDEQILEARRHLIADSGEGAEAAKQELEIALDKLDDYLDE
ncbi:hypothetical protein DQW50_16405 [Halorubrum sp. 48-1-W]|uniref:hypothetical protein n=1 Tax=Halorubrum sp. 48-1-W TaxID=2249761 RepID=UPI000DCB0A9C|nr:hypothetical protein [Halorubrum sp. 48-1-W]RAW44039.1 hypothetical protein DQW50_16405 [Halorubrum sp. 48-1-W]